RADSQKSFGDPGKSVSSISNVKMVQIVAQLAVPGCRRWICQTLLNEKLFNLFGGRLAGINYLNIFAHGLLYDIPEDRVMRTAEDESVGLKFIHLGKIFRRYRGRFRFCRPVLLGERNEKRATCLENLGCVGRTTD